MVDFFQNWWKGGDFEANNKKSGLSSVCRCEFPGKSPVIFLINIPGTVQVHRILSQRSTKKSSTTIVLSHGNSGHARTFFHNFMPIHVCMLPNLYSNRLSQACLFKQAIDDLDPIQTHQEKTTTTLSSQGRCFSPNVVRFFIRLFPRCL